MSFEYSELEEVTDYASHFTTRGGRLYQSRTITSPYPLPVDTPENEVGTPGSSVTVKMLKLFQRHQFQHRSLAYVVGENYTGPVTEILARQEAAGKVVIDLGCGTGEWYL